ncbi:MAG TPA: L-threonylcarbamoyladenylate synthase [Chloroflexia bacterium]|nr:L-threonylcarbamoyladenylate synthase [Chloroflexia bacterium]
MSRVKTRILTSDTNNALSLLAQELKEGRIAAFPTDTVYGMGCQAFNAEAVERLYSIKQRSRNKPIPILVTGPEQLALVTSEVTPLAERLIERFWPGALTLILRRHPDLPDAICAGGDTVAVRMPGHVMTLALIQEVGSPLATTSANISGRQSPLDAQQALFNLNGRIDVVLDAGPCPGGVDSTVVDATGEKAVVLRETAIPARLIREALS